MKKVYWVIMILVVVAVVGGIIYSSKRPHTASTPAAVSVANNPTPAVTVPVASSTPPKTSQTPKAAAPGVVWKYYTSDQNGFSFEYPLFTPKDFVSQRLVSEIDFSSWNQKTNLFDPDFSFYIHPNGANLSLHDWFEQNVDYNGLLLSGGIYQQKNFLSGLTAIVPTGTGQPVPQAYTNKMGQLNGAAFFESPDGKNIFTLSVDIQENNISQFGYTNDLAGYSKLIGQVLATVKFSGK